MTCVALKIEDVTAGRRKFETANVHTLHNNINNNCVYCNAKKCVLFKGSFQGVSDCATVWHDIKSGLHRLALLLL